MEKTRKLVENTPHLFVCYALRLVAPFAVDDPLAGWRMFKWRVLPALIFSGEGWVDVNDPKIVRLRWLVQDGFWGHVAVCLGAALWFGSEIRLGEYAGPLRMKKTLIISDPGWSVDSDYQPLWLDCFLCTKNKRDDDHVTQSMVVTID